MTSYRQSMKDTLQIMYDVREASLLEIDLTPDEEKRREEIAKDLPDDDFKKRYGDKWMSVKMATATKMMKKEELDLDERMRMPRQLIDTNKEVMIVKKNKVIVIDKKDQDKYMKQGWSLAEEVDLDEAKYTYKAATFNGNTVVGTGSTEEDAIKDAKNKAKELGSTLRKRISMKKEGVDLDEAKMYAIGYHFLHGLKNQNMKKSKDFKTKKEAEKAANDIVRAKGGRAEVYANMFDPGGRPGHQDYPKLLKTIKEEADLVDEAFKAGNLRLKDGKTVKIDKVTAESLNNAMSQLNSTNRKRMEVEAMKDKKSFDAMVQFAKAAV